MTDGYSQERMLEIGALVLGEMGASQSGALTVGSFIQQVLGEAEDDLYSKDVKALLEGEGLIERSKYVAGQSTITPHGMAVYRSGGLLWLMEERQKSVELEDDMKRSTIAANEKAVELHGGELRRWRWGFLVSLAMLAVALITLWMTC